MPILILLALIVGLPLIEIYFFIHIGAQIGAFTTILLTLFTAIAGVYIIRIQGLQTLLKAQQHLQQAETPIIPMLEGIFLALAAICLLFPGFLTDSFGVLLLIPPIRQFLAHWMIKNRQFVYQQKTSAKNHTIDGEYHHIQPSQESIDNDNKA